MKPFAALAVTTVPDVETARRLYGLGDLDEASVVKVLHHQNKQPGAAGTGLRPHEQRVAAVSVAALSGGELRLWTRTTVEVAEAAVLRKLFRAAGDLEALVTWRGRSGELAALRLRAMAHDLGARALFRLTDGDARHLALADRLDPAATGVTLDGAALALGLPGLLGSLDRDPWEAVRAGDAQALRERGELVALNLCLIALRHWRVSGAWSHKRAREAWQVVRRALARAEPPHLRRFLAAWPAD
jgi:predicted PolB exonuclease-like 3'-5' exonuclease